MLHLHLTFRVSNSIKPRRKKRWFHGRPDEFYSFMMKVQAENPGWSLQSIKRVVVP